MRQPIYEVLAARYATHQDRPARHNFLFPDDHDGLMPVDYYVWVVRGPVGAPAPLTIAVDTGMSARAAESRPGRAMVMDVAEAFRRAGVDTAEVDDVVITHMHFDHAGRFDLFPRATFHVQDAEVAFCTGRAMTHAALRWAFNVEDVVEIVRLVHTERIHFHDGTGEIAPDVTVHLIGGHTGGMQALRVPTARGWVVLASDATHLWANIRERRPFPIVASLPAMLEGYRTLEALADGPDHIIPGHDPLVRTRFPSHDGDPEVVRVDLEPAS